MKHYILLILFSLSFTFLLAQDKNISNGNVFEGEPYIAINPLNHQNIVVAWMGYINGKGLNLSIKIKASIDGGETWSNTIEIPHVSQTYKSADPSLAFNNLGELLLCYIDYRESPDSGGVYIIKSKNGGINWGNPVQVIDAYDDANKIPLDRPWMTVTDGGKTISVTTKPAPWIPAPNRPYYISSVDSGLTWSKWKYIDTSNFYVGNSIAAPMSAICHSGVSTIHTIYPSYKVSQSVYPQFILATTNNAGKTFKYQIALSGLNGTANDSAKLGYRLLADPKDSNHLAFIYLSSVSGDLDVTMIETYNAGSSWSSPLRINDDSIGNGIMQDLVWAAFDENCNLVITWRDRRNGNQGYASASDIYYSFRAKDSSKFSVNKKLNYQTAAYKNVLSQNGNDFMCVEMIQDTIYAVWGDTRDGNLDIWFSKVHAPSNTLTSFQSVEKKYSPFIIYPNPSNNNITIQNFQQKPIDNLYIYNASGQMMIQKSRLNSTYILDTQDLPKGIYIIKIKSEGQENCEKFIKE